MLVLHERKLKYQSIKTEHYHTNIFLLQKLGGAVSGIVWVDAIKVKCIMLRQNYSFAKLIWFYSLAQQLETSNQPSPRGHLFVTQTIPDILAQHSDGAQSQWWNLVRHVHVWFPDPFGLFARKEVWMNGRLGPWKWSVSRVGVWEHVPCFEPLPSIDLSRGEGHVTIRERTVEMKSP